MLNFKGLSHRALDKSISALISSRKGGSLYTHMLHSTAENPDEMEVAGGIQTPIHN